MNESKKKPNRRQREKNTRAIRICTFFAVLYVWAVIGLLIPLRPEVSALEKRTLETFPAFTRASFLDGSYFEGISTWYSDTFPFREKLLSANMRLQNLYGFKGEQVILSSDSAADTAAGEAEDAVTGEVSDVEETGFDVADLIDENAVDAAIDDEPEYIGDVYVSGDTGFVMFYDNYSGADDYIAMLNHAQADLDGTATVYSILAPVSSGIDLSERVQEKLGLGDQKAFIDYIYDGADSNIQTVETFDLLRSHNSEYLYFRTDHHWTALGAYYAYLSFCSVKGLEPTPLEDFETVEFPDFLGTLYSGSNQAAALGNHPDTVVAYIPNATNDMTYWTADYGDIDWNIVYDVSDYGSGDKYATFVSGDRALAWIDNPTLHDGSACVVVKDSYGNAFVPFLVDHYEHVYMVDYRYFSDCAEYNGSLYTLIREKGITDVILLNNVQFAGSNTAEQISSILR